MSQRSQGAICIVLGLATIVFEGLLVVLDRHYDSFQAVRAPALVVVGIALIVVGVLRLRGRISR